MLNVSIAPDGTEYPLPTVEDNEKERAILKQVTAEQRVKGRKIVAVQGLGFVGCVMATVVADAV
ncbi:MAG: nucleotide sugar dehydrogenase, partial [Candidatus Cloacimonetes bacterium]|nr:nucleotide sugar dehydrogenase [Candidatus Cloacimonadota bacterium]